MIYVFVYLFKERSEEKDIQIHISKNDNSETSPPLIIRISARVCDARGRRRKENKLEIA